MYWQYSMTWILFWVNILVQLLLNSKKPSDFDLVQWVTLFVLYIRRWQSLYSYSELLSTRKARYTAYISSASPSTELTVNKKTLKERGEPALQASVSQQSTAQSASSMCSPSSQSAFVILQLSWLAQRLFTVIPPSVLSQVFMHLSSPKLQVFKYLSLLSSRELFLQSSSLPLHT